MVDVGRLTQEGTERDRGRRARTLRQGERPRARHEVAGISRKPPATMRPTTDDPGRVGPRDAFRLARRKWRAGQRVDMSALSRELAVNRVTLYRWVGSREQLLVEVIWELARCNLEKADAAVQDSGAERVVQIVSRFIEKVIAHKGMQYWLANEGESAIRLMTRYQAGFQPRLVEWLERLLHEEVDAGRLELPADVHEVAFVLEQLIESYVYLYPISGEQPRPQRAEPILRMLLR
jgi:AcrR family transcriptional regulator